MHEYIHVAQNWKEPGFKSGLKLTIELMVSPRITCGFLPLGTMVPNKCLAEYILVDREVFHGDDVAFDVVKNDVVVDVANFVHDFVQNGRNRDSFRSFSLGNGESNMGDVCCYYPFHRIIVARRVVADVGVVGYCRHLHVGFSTRNCVLLAIYFSFSNGWPRKSTLQFLVTVGSPLDAC
jgi:hypothetical protein